MFIAGCVVGSVVGGLAGVFMICLVVTGKKEDEQMASLISEKDQEKDRICFIDSKAKELFWIFDGGSIQLTAGNGEHQSCICHYEDKEHVRINGQLWQMQEFARQMEERGIVYTPV